MHMFCIGDVLPIVLLVLAQLANPSPANADVEALPFGPAASVELEGVPNTAGLIAADFNRDGRLDLVALSGATARIKVLLNEANGYRAVSEFDAGASVSRFATGNFNGDAEIDIAVVHHDTDELWLFFGTGGGKFDAPKKVRVPATKPHAHMLVAADANADRLTDLLLAQADDNQVWVLLGDGKGGFTPSSGSPISTGNHPYVIVASDFNGDGHLDCATPNWYGRSVSVFLGDGQGRFKPAPNGPIAGFAAPTGLAAADLTGDGKIDLAVCNDDSSTVQILAGDGKGSFARGQIADLQAMGDCFAPILADITGDGKLDVLATAVNGAQTFSYWINLGDGKFSQAHALRCAPVASRICVADLNGDGMADLAVGTWDEARVDIWFGRRAAR